MRCKGIHQFSFEELSIVTFSRSNWSSAWKRHQSIIDGLVKELGLSRALWIGPVRWIFSSESESEGWDSFPETVISPLIPRPVTSITRVLSLFHFLPFKKYISSVVDIEARFLAWQVRFFLPTRNYILFINDPSESLAPTIKILQKDACLSVYDISDDFSEFHTHQGSEIEKASHMRKVLETMDLVLAVNKHVGDKFKGANLNTHVITNATHGFAKLSMAPPPDHPVLQIKKRAQPIVGYIGSFNESRIDWDMLISILVLAADMQFVFIGPMENSFQKKLLGFPNVTVIKPIPREDLGYWMSAMDVGIVPFKKNLHTAGNDLLKVYDYLSADIPVVATNCSNLVPRHGVMHIAVDSETFVDGLRKSFELKNDTCAKNEREKFVADYLWPVRINQVADLIRRNLEVSE